MEVALAVGGVVAGAFLSSFLAVAFDRSSRTRKFIDFFQGKTNIKFDVEILHRLLDRLEITLDAISMVLEDADDKQVKSPAVRRWIGNLEGSVNHADDLLDEFNTECLRLKLEYDYEFQQKQTEADLKLTLKPAFIEEFMPNLKKVIHRLEYFVYQIHVLGLRKIDHKEKVHYRVPSSSVVDKSQVFGRDGEKEKMIERVLSDGEDSDVSVIAITGLGGIGKTTLAQLVYDDDQVKGKLTTRAWVCVSEEYDALRVTRALLMEVNPAVVDDKDDFNRLQVKLKHNLAGKCFLIVLDDIWIESYTDWRSLKSPLNCGRRGSKIIVTTRNEKVALMMQNEPFHRMHPIPEDQSWCLFKSHAFDNENQNLSQEFETIGKEIVMKCKGLPLAIKTVAGALRCKRDINVWQDILDSEDWAATGDILPALSLSYKHLPSHLKCCFGFCALFHKGIPFDKDEVILLWMANDLVKPSTQKDGRVYFEELKSRSFFESMDGKKYIMHDLINDLARSVTRNSRIRLEDYQLANCHQSIQPELLHFSYLASDSSKTSEAFSGIAQARSLRTFLLIHNIHKYQNSRYRHRSTFSFSNMLPIFQRLRALCLSHSPINMVPDSIGDLKHLRFLNLAATDIEKLPNSISKCLNLQTLILANCEKLVELPKDMRLLVNLQYLDIQGVGNPFIGKLATVLKDIENVSVFVDKIHGSELELLAQLQLSHSFSIIGLGDADVVTIEKAKSLGLSDIENLTLEWSGSAESSQDELNKFTKLQPHTNTKKLTIKGYKGTRFPYWLGDSAFSNMESLSLINCNNCFSLPPLGQLTGLKKLEISGMDGISEIGKEFYGAASTSKPFLALEYLEFNDMVEWAIWNTHWGVDFSSLKSLRITNCPKLVSVFRRGGSSDSISLFSFSKLQHVHIENIGGLNLLNGYDQTLTSLQSLKIHNCNNILSFPEGGLPAPNLKKLYVEKCEKMKSLPARMHRQLPLLTELGIDYCPEIEWFPEGGLPSSLERLEISNCSKIKSLPARMHTQLPLLTYLSIGNCPEIECFRKGGLPSSLERLWIWNCSKMRSCQTNWGLQTLRSLKEVELSGFDDTLFPEEGLLPTTLQTLTIREFSNLESLNEKGLQHLFFLQSLSICNCRNLKYLPQQRFSSNLSSMTIHDCELVESFPRGLASFLTLLLIMNCRKLEARIEREVGEDWPKVSHIPLLYVNSCNTNGS